MKIYFPMLIVGLFVFLTGCQSGPKIQSESNPEVDFSQYKTFYLLPLPTRIQGADPGTMMRYGRAAREGIDEAMEAKGFVEAASAEEADISINVGGKVVPKVQVTDLGFHSSYYRGRGYAYRGSYWGGAYPYGGGVDVRQYEEGTLVIEIFDGETKEPVWVGWTTGRKKSGNRTDEEIKAILAIVLSGFPP